MSRRGRGREREEGGGEEGEREFNSVTIYTPYTCTVYMYMIMQGVYTPYKCTLFLVQSIIHARNSCKTLIGVHEVHGRMHPN